MDVNPAVFALVESERLAVTLACRGLE